ncbi:MAG TPA: hypothetical protein VMO47_13910 [Rhodothermales bacterium]|nr:hypothetical protein [Rhodothermales bacterium]
MRILKSRVCHPEETERRGPPTAATHTAYCSIIISIRYQLRGNLLTHFGGQAAATSVILT